MPDVLTGLTDSERARVAEALTHHLLSKAPVTFRQTLPDTAAVARGDALYHRLGCVTCHAPAIAVGNEVPSVPLPQLSDKWSFDGLRQFLRDPLATRPSGRMPSLTLSEGEAADLAHYLLRETKVPAVLAVNHYGGRLTSLEDLDSAEPIRREAVNTFGIELRKPGRGYALRFTGWLQIQQTGDYTFHLTATGASRLSVAEQWLVGEDSWQRERVAAQRTIHLNAGWQPVTVDYVQRGSEQANLKVEWEGPGIAREVIPAARLRNEREPVPEPVVFVVDAAKAVQGRVLYEQLSCGTCHDATPPLRPRPLLAQLPTSGGCLAERPDATVPDFRLNAVQRAGLSEALAELNRPDLTVPSASQRVAHTLASFRCTACHTRAGGGGVPASRAAFFTSNGEDLGDEGRLPPSLDGVGDKLQPEWLSRVLSGGANVRPYLNTRMPQFGATNVSHLVDLFIRLDRRPQPLKPASDPPSVQRDIGRRLVGTDGLSCIACHRFNRQPAHALQVIDLITTPARLNEDWFRRFLLDPNRFNPGTRMPAFWPDGVSPLPTVCAGDTERQQAAIWTYLADGAGAKFPEGLSRQNVELVVGGEAVVYRGKLWQAGFRALAVGYPGQVNAAYDAEELRLALIWRGRFLNAGPHWGVQGMGQIRPLGTEVVVFPAGPALAVLAGAEAPWPAGAPQAARQKFLGYQLDTRQQPTVLYRFDDAEVQDFLSPVEVLGRSGLRRTLTFTGQVPAGLHLRLAVGKLTVVAEQRWRLAETVDLRVDGGVRAIVRGHGEQQELLVPINTNDAKTQVEVEYVW